MVFWFQFGDVSPNAIWYIWNKYYKITNAIFHAYRIRWFLEQFLFIMSTGMGCLSKYRFQYISNSTEISTASFKITQNFRSPMSALRSPLSALRSTLTYLNPPSLANELWCHPPKMAGFQWNWHKKKSWFLWTPLAHWKALSKSYTTHAISC
jgi:hypothetical protein